MFSSENLHFATFGWFGYKIKNSRKVGWNWNFIKVPNRNYYKRKRKLQRNTSDLSNFHFWFIRVFWCSKLNTGNEFRKSNAINLHNWDEWWNWGLRIPPNSSKNNSHIRKNHISKYDPKENYSTIKKLKWRVNIKIIIMLNVIINLENLNFRVEKMCTRRNWWCSDILLRIIEFAFE